MYPCYLFILYIENKLMVTSRERKSGRGQISIGE